MLKLKINLIEKYLTTENLKGSDYIRKYKEVYDYIKNVPPYKFDLGEIDLRNILSEEIIPSPVYEKNLEEIRSLENKLIYENLTPYERIRLKDELRKFTLSVHPNDIKNYERARNNGQAINFKRVCLSKYKNDYIKVIECEYEEVGYKRMKYDEANRSSNIW